MTEKNMWNLSPEEALKACQTSEQGLSTEQAEKIRLEAGENDAAYSAVWCDADA